MSLKRKPGDKKKTANDLLRALSFLSQIGITMAACVFIGVFIGKFLDNLFGTSPWLLIIFALLGGAAAIKSIFTYGKGG